MNHEAVLVTQNKKVICLLIYLILYHSVQFQPSSGIFHVYSACAVLQKRSSDTWEASVSQVYHVYLTTFYLRSLSFGPLDTEDTS